MANSSIRTVIVDPDGDSRHVIRELLKQAEDTEIASEIPDGKEASRLLVDLDPDLIIMDLQLPDADPFEILADLGDAEGLPVVILISEDDASALRAFDTTAVDFVRKPVKEAAFSRALSRARAKLNHAGGVGRADDGQDVDEPEGGYRSRLLVKERDSYHFVAVEQIRWIEAEGNYARIHSQNGTHLIRSTLTDLAASLDPRQFMRVHRGSVVNLDRIESITPSGTSDYRIILEGGAKLNVGRSFRDRLLGREDGH